MSLLAEKKQRNKWSLNPRGKSWTNDTTKIGQKMLEKMGWSPGEGLGALKQGIKENVKSKGKSDTAGLGFKNNSEEWLKQQSEFSDLLASLSGDNTEVEENDVSISAGRNSLELKSKQSRARVHYHKFTRGKDLSRYSIKDLAQIMGPDSVNSHASNKSSEDNSNLVSCGSMADYFKGKGLSWPVNDNYYIEKTVNAESENDSKSLWSDTATDDVAIQHSGKKYKNKNCIPLCTETGNSVLETSMDLFNSEQESRKKKKKKEKHNRPVHVDNNERNFDNDNSTTFELKGNSTLENNSNTVENNSCSPQSDKKKRKKRKQHNIDTKESENSMDKDNNNYAEGFTENNSYVSSSKKKKKKEKEL